MYKESSQQNFLWAQMSHLDKDFKSPIINMIKELKEIMIKQVKYNDNIINIKTF